MNPIIRGVKNAFRNMIRTFSIVIILGISVGLSLSMLVARQAVDAKILSVKQSIGNTINITPAGARGFEGGGEPLTTDQMTAISAMTNVTNVIETLSDRLTSTDTSLVSAIDAGSLGNRAQSTSGVGFQIPPDAVSNFRGGSSTSSGTTPEITRTFTPPVTVTGTNNATAAAVYGGDTYSFASGAAINPTQDDNSAVLGKAIADKNSLAVGSTFTAYGQTMNVVGIFDTGNAFANNGVIVSLPALQRLSAQTGAITSATITVNSVDNIDAVVAAIKTELGTKADVVSSQASAKTAVQPLESVKTISTYSVIGAIGAGAVIILLTMMMIVRERRREIGVMKAIGSSNIKTMVQFVSEAITLTVLGLIVGIVIGVFAAQPITKVLVNNSTSTSTTSQQTPGAGGFGGRSRAVASTALQSVRDVQTTVGLDLLGYGFGVALLIAILGSALPAFLLSKVRPAEAMRAE